MNKSMFKYSISSIIDSIGVIDNELPVREFWDNILLGESDSINVLVLTLELGGDWAGEFTQEEIRPILGIPSDKYATGSITVNYPNETIEASPRRT